MTNNIKETFRNNVILKMHPHLDKTQMMILQSVLSECLYNLDIVETSTLPATSMDTNEYILSLYEAKRSLVLKESTMGGYMIAAKELVRYVNKPLVLMDKEDIEYYLRSKKKEGNTGTSLNNKRRKILALFRWMVKQNFILYNPVEDIDKFKEVKKPVEYLKAEDMEQLKEGCKNKRDRALLEYFRSTACRRGEVPYVTINQIDWNTGQILIYGEKTETYRNVYLDGVAMMYIKSYLIDERGVSLNSNEPLFTHLRGDTSKGLGKGGLYDEVKNIAERSGIARRIYPHIFRSTTATNIVRRGGTSDQSGHYLGHTPNNVTLKHYIAEFNTFNIFNSFVAQV